MKRWPGVETLLQDLQAKDARIICPDTVLQRYPQCYRCDDLQYLRTIAVCRRWNSKKNELQLLASIPGEIQGIVSPRVRCSAALAVWYDFVAPQVKKLLDYWESSDAKRRVQSDATMTLFVAAIHVLEVLRPLMIQN